MSTHSKGLLEGNFNGNHSTVVKEARGLIRLLKKSPEVIKISLGIILPFEQARGE